MVWSCTNLTSQRSDEGEGRKREQKQRAERKICQRKCDARNCSRTHWLNANSKASKKLRLQSPKTFLIKKSNCAGWGSSSRTLPAVPAPPLTREVSAWNTSLEGRPKPSNNFGKLSFGKQVSPKASVYLGECLKSFMVLRLNTFNCTYHTQDHQPSNTVTRVVHYCMVNLPNYSWVIFSSRSTELSA